jgi:riboflavin kinase
MEISPPKGFCRGKLAETCFIDNLKCAIIKPEVENYPQDVIELMAPINLRKTFKLKDGDTVEVKITIP